MPSMTSSNDLFKQIRSSLAGVLAQELPEEKKISLGDAAAASMFSIKQIFAADGSFQDDLQISEFDIVLRKRSEDFAVELLPFFYHSHLLSEKGRMSVQKEWLAIFKKEDCDADGKLALRIPLSVFVITKNRNQ